MIKILSHLKNIISLLEVNQKINLIYVFIIYIISILMEVISIGMIIPILNLIFIGELNQTFSEFLPSYLINNNKQQLLSMVLIFFFIFYIIKTVFSTFALWFHRRFIYKLQESISLRLLNKYIIEDYEVFLQRNYSDTVRNVAVEAGVFVTGVIHGVVAFATETMVIISISVLLLIVDPTSSSLIIGIIFILITSYLLFFRNKLRNLGKRRQQLEGLIFDQLNKSFQLFREIKIFSKHNNILKSFQNTIDEKNKIALFEDLVNGLPKIYFELIFVLLVTSFLFFLILTGNDINFIIPILGLYTAAFFKIFPSFNRIISNINGVIHNYAAFDIIQKDLKILTKIKLKPKNINDYPLLSEHIISEQKPHTLDLENLSFSFLKEGDSETILENINLKLSSGQITGLIGESGSGKSTLANIISGFLKADFGSYRINENENYNKNLLKNLVGYLPQTTNLINDTLLNNICFLSQSTDQYDQEKINYLIKILDLENLINSLPQGLNTIIKEQGQILSGGQRQKIALARALYKDKPILIFDESTSSLDTETEFKLMNVINNIKKKRLILFITHNRSLIKFFDKTYELKDKKINVFKK